MIINLTKGFVPESYSESRDYRVFLKLASLVVSVLKDEIDKTPSLYSPYECPKEFLKLLSDMVGYDLLSSRTVETNRIIIDYFPSMIRYRGSSTGIKMAVSLSVNTSNKTPQFSIDDIVVDYDYDKGIIKIYYPRDSKVDRDLIEYVRPVGSRVELIPSFANKNTDELDIKVDVFKEEESWNKYRTEVEKSKVGFGDVGNSEQGGE